MTDLLPLLAATFGASLAGSLHCAGMCGPLVALWAAPGGAPGAVLARHATYHGARGAGYVTLGALAGGLGLGVDRLGDLAGLGRLAAVVTGLALVVAGALRLLRAGGVPVGLPLPGPLARALGRLPGCAPLGRLRGAGPWTRALLLGLVTPLLPCGWLWLFVLAGAGAGGPLAGAAVLAAFWAGTLPILLALGLGVGRAAGGPLARLRQHAPWLTGGAFVVAGALLLALRAPVDVRGGAAHGAVDPAAPAPAALVAPASPAEGVAFVASAGEAVPACCRGHKP